MTHIKNFLIILLVLIFSVGSFNLSVEALKTKIVKKKKERTFRPDFRDKDIQLFIKAMSAIIGKNIVTSGSISGKITIISPRRIPVSQGLNYLKSVLAVRKIGVFVEGSIIKILPMKDAIATSTVIHYGRDSFKFSQLQRDRIVTHIVPIIGYKASKLKNILRQLTNSQTKITPFDEADVLILTGGAFEVNRLVKIILKIDKEQEVVPVEDEVIEGDIHVYYLENMEAEKIAATLRKLTIPPDGLRVAKKNISTKTNKKTAKTKRSKAKKKKDKNKNRGNRKIQVVAHKESNSLIFIGTPEEYKPILALIKKIDIKREQVLIEVLIVEVAADDTNSFGIDWRMPFPADKSDPSKGGGFGQFNTGVTASSGLLKSDGTISSGINTLFGLSLGFITGTADGLMGMIQANIKKDNFTILSAPQILTLTNEKAVIDVGEDVPVRTAQRQSGAGDQAIVVDSYEYRPTGIKIEVTPQINKSKVITLKMKQSVKAISGNTGDLTANPRFKKRNIENVVRVKDNQTIVIGGLISSDKTKSVHKIPILGDIPLLGYLFKRTSTVIKKSNMLIFITPHIISNDSILDRITKEAREHQSEYFFEPKKTKK